MSYSESESDFSNFAINSAWYFGPTFSESKSESHDSESDFNWVFMNLGTCTFLPYIYTLLNKLADDFFLFIFKTESIVMQAMQVWYIFSFGIPLTKKFVFITPSNSLTLVFKYLFINRFTMKFNS